MIVAERNLKGVFEIQLKPIADRRGFFMRVYDDEIFSEYNMNRKWVQENHSLSVEKGIIRGFHFQFPPHAETKLVRVIAGEILDVFIDLRKDSPTFGKWDSIRLSAENKRMIYIPRGLAHGFCTLSENCQVIYKVDNYYSPESEGGIIWNDPDLDIEWPVKDPILSEKDSNAKTFKEFQDKYGALKL
jgi:dTDP-4-dehydrorhamnose 3,5-epimerase